jgi:transcriptional regulator with XRE-family HTH domain
MARKQEIRVNPGTLRRFRGFVGRSQSTLAAEATVALVELTGDHAATISPSTLSMIEAGQRQPSLQTAEAIAKALGVDVTDFAEVLVDIPDNFPERRNGDATARAIAHVVQKVLEDRLQSLGCVRDAA